MNVKNKTAIITGGGGGIGRKCALLFAEKGAHVAIWEQDKEMGEETVQQIKEEGGQGFFCAVDVRDWTQITEALKKTQEEFPHIDILINNAGITRDGFLVKTTTWDWQKVLDVNLTGVFQCTKAVAAVMLEQGSGCIINASSVVGIYGNMGQTNYAATKAGVIGLTKTWARELGGRGIRVNAVAPGFIETPMTEKVPEKILSRMEEKTPLGRLGQVEDVAWVYLFLASEKASFIHGAVIPVDGGLIL